MKKIITWLQKRKLVVFASALAIFLGIGATTAWFTDIEAAINTIRVGSNDIVVDEEVVGLTKQNIKIKNSGSIPVYVRMAVDISEGVTYTDGEGKPQTVTFEKTPKEPLNWRDGGDGYWYYDEVLEAGKEAVLFKSVGTSQDIPKTEMERIKDLLDITVYGESVQSEGLNLDGIEGVNDAQKAFRYLAQKGNAN